MQESDKNLFEELLHHTEENILARVVMTLMMMGDHIEVEGPLKEEGTKVRMGGHQIEEVIMIEEIWERIFKLRWETP